jgi:hypothetical protein
MTDSAIRILRQLIAALDCRVPHVLRATVVATAAGAITIVAHGLLAL